MVETILITKVLKRLEKYLIQKTNFVLAGYDYDLILFVPSDKYLSDIKFSLLVSSKQLDSFNQKEAIKELLTDFKENLNIDEYNAISRINIINSNDPFVKNLSFSFSIREPLIEIKEMPIGGIRIDLAYLVRSMILDKLKVGQAVAIELIDGQVINAGIIRIESNFDIIHYTGKGLREIWKPGFSPEHKQKAETLKKLIEDVLIEKNYLAKTNLDNIIKIL